MDDGVSPADIFGKAGKMPLCVHLHGDTLVLGQVQMRAGALAGLAQGFGHRGFDALGRDQETVAVGAKPFGQRPRAGDHLRQIGGQRAEMVLGLARGGDRIHHRDLGIEAGGHPAHQDVGAHPHRVDAVAQGGVAFGAVRDLGPLDRVGQPAQSVRNGLQRHRRGLCRGAQGRVTKIYEGVAVMRLQMQAQPHILSRKRVKGRRAHAATRN